MADNCRGRVLFDVFFKIVLFGCSFRGADFVIWKFVRCKSEFVSGCVNKKCLRWIRVVFLVISRKVTIRKIMDSISWQVDRSVRKFYNLTMRRSKINFYVCIQLAFSISINTCKKINKTLTHLRKNISQIRIAMHTGKRGQFEITVFLCKQKIKFREY